MYMHGEVPRHEPLVAVVGARAASRAGLTRAHGLAGELAKRGALVVSGGAVGVDAAAHRGALAAGAPTVAVLASALDTPYPARHRPLFRDIVASGGALLSPFPPGTPLRRWHFPRRNQALAELVDAVVVVEASAASGSLHTAVAARRAGRVLGACPGTPGTDALLFQGAALVETAADVLAALAGAPRRLAVARPEPGTDAAAALDALDGTVARDAAELARRCGLGVGRVARALCALELDGLALPVPGGSYVRSQLIQG
jgi:DNA processing protein